MNPYKKNDAPHNPATVYKKKLREERSSNGKLISDRGKRKLRAMRGGRF